MRIRWGWLPRPSAALVLSLVALFVSLGGVGYAAFALPRNSVGASQLRDASVTSSKIKPGAVGVRRANIDQMQARVTRGCPNEQAISKITRSGGVACASTLPHVYSTPDGELREYLGDPLSLTLPANGSYMAFANPETDLPGGHGHETITCTLTVGGSSQTRSVTVDSSTDPGQTYRVVIPLHVSGHGSPATLKCTPWFGAGSLTGGIQAIQTAN